MHTILKVLTVTLLMLEAAGCGCTELDCSDVFEVALNKATVWGPGSYVVSVDADGKKNSCTFSVPSSEVQVCTNAAEVQLQLRPITGPSNEVKGAESVSIFGAPAGVQVTVARDGVPLGTTFFLPSYTEQQPNGALCGPTCHVSSGELAID